MKIEDNCIQQKRNIYIDCLKVLAIFLIVITHDPWSVEHAKLPLFTFFIDMAVPIFMIVSGYNYTVSFRRNEIASLKDLYNTSLIKKRINRIIVPYAILFTVEILLLVIFKNKQYSIVDFFLVFVKGGYGPGAYYTPIIIQLVFLFPLLYFIIQKFKTKGLFFVFILNLIFESVYTFCGFPNVFYPFIIIRYIFIIALGVYWAVQKAANLNIWIYILSTCVGLLYLIVTRYFFEPKIFTRWTTTSMMSGFYLFPLILLGEYIIINVKGNVWLKQTVILCSKSTFHIYLFQMFYYYIGIERIFYTMTDSMRIFGDVIICVSGGMLFYLFTEKLLKRLLKKG